MHSRLARETELYTPPGSNYTGVDTCSALHKLAETVADDTVTEVFTGDDSEPAEGEDVINGLVLFVPGAPSPGLKS